MIAPRLAVRHRDVEYAVTQRGEAWVIEVEGAQYFLTAGDDPLLQARAYVRRLPRNTTWPRTPAWIASPRNPLVLSIDGTIVRAWPVRPTRDDPAQTYIHPQWGHRVQAIEQEAVWMFAARGREASPGGAAVGEQSAGDVEALARAWLPG